MGNSQIDRLLDNSLIEDKPVIRNNSVIRILIVIGMACLIFSIFSYFLYTKEESKITVIETNTVDQNTLESIFIDISGAVVKPGLYELAKESRTNDAIAAAGGFREDADAEWIQKELNLAEPLLDGQKIYVPFKGEEGVVLSEKKDNLININKADASQLESLPGIGPVTAAKIIEFREERGKLSSVEELLEIQGIGPQTLEEIRDFIVLN
ncbi:MAG: helix-hairpin-helix domain-containing protein [Patescibacteria group bacterium]|jgi:competence protein ComEA